MCMPLFGPCYHCGRLHNELYFDYINKINILNNIIKKEKFNIEISNIITKQFNNLFSKYHKIDKPCCQQHIITYI